MLNTLQSSSTEQKNKRIAGHIHSTHKKDKLITKHV